MSSLREAAEAVMREWESGVLGYQLDAAFAVLKDALAQQEPDELRRLHAENERLRETCKEFLEQITALRTVMGEEK